MSRGSCTSWELTHQFMGKRLLGGDARGALLPFNLGAVDPQMTALEVPWAPLELCFSSVVCALHIC